MVDFHPADAIQPGGVVMDGSHGPLGICGDGVAQRGCPRLDGQLLKKGGVSRRREGTGERSTGKE